MGCITGVVLHISQNMTSFEPLHLKNGKDKEIPYCPVFSFVCADVLCADRNDIQGKGD